MFELEVAQALASEALRQRAVVQERTSWRQAVSEVLTAAAAADGLPSAPLHVLAAWLSVLPWLADSRWRRLRTGNPQNATLCAICHPQSYHALLISLGALQQPGGSRLQHPEMRYLRGPFHAHSSSRQPRCLALAFACPRIHWLGAMAQRVC